MGRANSDPSPVEHQLGQSIVSNRVPAFRVTSPSLPLAGGAAGSFSSMRPERISSQKEAIMLSKHDTQNYIMIISPLWFINSLIQIPPQSKMHACSPIEACSEHGKQHCSNIVQYHWYFFWPVLRSTPEPPTQHTLSWQTSTTSWLSSRLHQSWFTHLEHDVNTQSWFFKFTVTGGGKSFMTPHFSFVMGECGHMAKEQQSFKCKFVFFL